jgi:hypothetical protein
LPPRGGDLTARQARSRRNLGDTIDRGNSLMPRAIGQVDQIKAGAMLDAPTVVISERGLSASVEAFAPMSVHR